MQKRKVLSSLSHNKTDARERERKMWGDARNVERNRRIERRRIMKKKKKDCLAMWKEFHAREILPRDKTSAVQEKWRRRKRGKGGERM